MSSALASQNEAWELARRLRADNMKWAAVARATGLTVETLRRKLDPGYSRRRCEELRNKGSKVVGKILHVYDGVRIKPEEAKRALRSVPLDTRPFFARMMGDPLPGRSALERRQ